MDQNRRDFLRLFAPAKAYAETPGSDPTAGRRPPHYVMVVDLRRCVGCQACTIACTMENRVPAYRHRTIASDYEITVAGVPRRAPLPRLCNHCDRPPCVAGCPTKATYKRPDGLVVVDSSVCVGCAYCVQNCPYDARFMNEATRTADKCTFCVQRLESGLLPACVETCVGKARVFGDLNDPRSAVAKLLRSTPAQVLKSEKGTRPQVFYLAMDDALRDTVRGTAAPFAQPRPGAKEG
jgi:tetrathionate reductase subunit B